MNDFDKRLRDSLTSVQQSYAEERQADRIEMRARFIQRYRSRRRMFVIGSVALAGAAVVAVGLVAGGSLDIFADRSPSEVAGRPQEGVSVRVETGKEPIDAGIRPGGVWVANAGGSSIAHVDTESNTVVERILLDGSPQEVDVGENAVWVAGFGRVTAIDPRTDEILGFAPVGDASDAISISVGEGAVWAVVGEKSLVRIEPSTFATDVIEQVEQPVDVAARDGAIWVVEQRGVMKLDPATSEVLGEPITVPAGQADISAGLGAVWIADKQDDRLIRIDAATSAGLKIFEIEGRYLDLAVTEDAAWVLSSAGGRGLLTAIDPVNGTALGASLELAGDPVEVSIGGGGVWVVARSDGSILRIDPERVID
ncbi:MAG TPA: hypothetical protein VE174_05800 [Actinomycetota bacterium]|nr:hypothetical protein [Actinomycetota bacterium]